MFDVVKRKLNITWDDVDTDLRVSDIIDDAIPTMRHKLGLPADYDFSEIGMERTLFLEYCLYVWNEKKELFDDNYRNDILQTRDMVAIARSDEDV